MSKNPKISVVMPVYNGSATIGNAIASIINQTIDDWELVIVDDGSADVDKTREIVKSFGDAYKILFIENVHEGIVGTRNLGNSLASANLIAIQDADDLSMPDRLEKALENIGDADVFCHATYVNMWDQYWGAISRSYIPALPLDLDRLKKEQYISGHPVFKKSLWGSSPFRKETQFCYDWMMHLDWALSGAKYKMFDVGLYEYVRQQNSASQVFERDGRRKESMATIREIVKNVYEN